MPCPPALVATASRHLSQARYAAVEAVAAMPAQQPLAASAVTAAGMAVAVVVAGPPQGLRVAPAVLGPPGS